MVCDSWLVISIRFVCFVFQGSLLCDRLVSCNNASQIFMIFLILVTCKNKATSASFRQQKIHSPSWFPSLLLSSLESFSAKLDVHVTLWFALTPPSLKWLTEQKNPKSLLRSILEFSIYTVVCCLSPVNFLGHFRISPSLCFKARQTAKPLAWQWSREFSSSFKQNSLSQERFCT